MKEDKEVEWEQFMDKLVKQAGLETPAPGFTDRVLSQIGEEQSLHAVLRYRPLISRVVWIFLGIVLTGLVVWSALQTPESVTRWFNFVPWDTLSISKFFQAFYSWSVPGYLVYSAFAIFGFVFMQVWQVRHSGDQFYNMH
jgi:hypothetical protein